ncbi:morphogenic membrane protein MmpA [Streptomyces sp. P9-A2]
MTTCRASKPVAPAVRPTGRAMAFGLALAVLAGVGWIAGMIYTVLERPF